MLRSRGSVTTSTPCDERGRKKKAGPGSRAALHTGENIPIPMTALTLRRSIFFSQALLALMFCGAGGLCPASAQSATVMVPPATLISPRLQPDGTAVFHLAMPNAAKVELNLEGMKAPLPMR